MDIIKVKQIAFKNQSETFYEVYDYKDITTINGLNGVDAMLNLCENGHMVVSVYSYFIKRQMLVDNEIYFIEGIYSEDIDWTPKVFMVATKVATLDEFVYCRRQNRPGQVTYKANLKRDLDCAKIIDTWYKQKESLTVFKSKKNADYFWDYLSNIYVGLVSNQYLYKGVESEQRIKELSKYAYMLKYLDSGKYKKFNIIYKVLGFKTYVLIVSYIKNYIEAPIEPV